MPDKLFYKQGSPADAPQEAIEPPSEEITEEEIYEALSPPDLRGRINLRTEYALAEEIQNIAEDTDYPFHSSSQVVRYCCLVGVRRLRKWKRKPTLLGAIRAANSISLQDKLQCDTVDLLHRMEERLAWYIDHKEADAALEFFGRMRSCFDGTQDSFWKKHILQQLDARFAKWRVAIDEIVEEQRNKS